jgi:hypothetical protein
MAEVAPAARWLPEVDRRWAIRLAVALVLLLSPWPGVGRGFAAIFSGYANVVVAAGGLGGDARPRFSLPPQGQARAEDGGAWAVRLAASGADDSDTGLLLDTRILGYTPLAVALALVAASRLPRRRRLRVLGFALACLLLRTGLAIALPVARAFSATRTGWAFGPVPETLWFAFLTPPAMSYATPIAAWWLGFALTTPRASPPVSARSERPARRSRGGRSLRRSVGRRARAG